METLVKRQHQGQGEAVTCVSKELGCFWLSLGGKNGLFSQVSAITQAAPAPARACAPAREAVCVRKT